MARMTQRRKIRKRTPGFDVALAELSEQLPLDPKETQK